MKPGGTPPAAGGSMPMARIRARCVAAWEFAQGKSGPDGKYWTSSCMYRPEGKVSPSYSTWQPTEGKIEPIANADQSATRRLVDPRGDLIRGKTIASTLLGVSGAPSHSIPRGNQTAVGSPFLVPPARACWPGPDDWTARNRNIRDAS